MSVPERPVDAAALTSEPSRPRSWTTGHTSLLLGVLTVALLPVTYLAVVRAALRLALELFLSGTGASPSIVVAIVAILLTTGCAMGAIAVGSVALLRRRDPVVAAIGVALGLVPFVALGALVLERA